MPAAVSPDAAPACIIFIKEIVSRLFLSAFFLSLSFVLRDQTERADNADGCGYPDDRQHGRGGNHVLLVHMPRQNAVAV